MKKIAPVNPAQFVPLTDENEIKCIICDSYPLDPMECQTCNAIKCHECMKAHLSAHKPCCKKPHYDDITHKTKILLENLTIQCRYCSHDFKSMNIAQHEKECPHNDHKTQTLSQQSSIELTEMPVRKTMKKAHFIGAIVIGIVSSALMITTFFFAIKLIFVKDDPTFHIVCTGQFTGSEGICIFAFGQFAVGIITISQFGVGLINISQFGIGLLFGIGQATSGIGFSIGQLASSAYVFRAQVGIALLAIGKAQVGMQCLKALYKKTSPVIVNCRKPRKKT